MKLGGILALAAALVLTGCASAPPPVSDKVQQYYDQNVAGNKATLAAAPVAKTVVFIGDSYASGSGTSAPAQRWTSRVSVAHGWHEVNLAQGGTGYLSKSTDPGAAPRLNYEEVIAAAVNAKPDAVVVSGGRNDTLLPVFAVQQATSQFYTDLRAALPKAVVIAVSPVWDASTPPKELAQLAGTVKASVEGVGGTYLDVGEPLTGKPELITGDKIHPNDQGAAALADATNAAFLRSSAAAALAN
jgi:lysophospholipase L1-like esterase